MTRMRTVDAAVRILEIEGATQAFGLPGAAINPFYSAMRADGSIRHILARHVEGAAHMAEGYTRTAVGNIGVCIGTSGPAGTDMITGLYSASADSIPILAITGQAPVDRLHKEDFQAVDIAAIAAPVTKMAMTVLEPGQVRYSSICPSMSSWLRSISILSPISRCRSTSLRHREPRPQRPLTCWCPPSGP